MKKQHLATLFLLVVFLVATQAAAAEPAIIGAPKCKICHTAKTGNQWEKWLDSNHAKAFTALASDEAKQIAAAQGLGDPQQEAGLPQVPHDPGVSRHRGCRRRQGQVRCQRGCRLRVLSRRRIGLQGAQGDAGCGRIQGGRTAPGPERRVLPKCHNEESPTFKGFDFEESWAKIAHPVTESE